MDNRKVYVGFVVTTIDPTTPKKALTILPLMSGYRAENGGEIVFTTYYERVYERISDETLDHLSVDHFRIVLPTTEFTRQTCSTSLPTSSFPITSPAVSRGDANGERSGRSRRPRRGDRRSRRLNSVEIRYRSGRWG